MKTITRIFYIIIIWLLANLPSLMGMMEITIFIPIFILFFIFMNIVPSIANMKLQSRRLRICGNGCELLILFLGSTTINTFIPF